MKKLISLASLVLILIGFQYLLNCADPLEPAGRTPLGPTIPGDTIFSIDTVYLFDTVGTVDTVIITDSSDCPDTIFIIDTVGTVDTLIIIDTVSTNDTIFVVDTVESIDTVQIIDTVGLGDTIYVIDTVETIDTIQIIDTLGITDTLFIVDTVNNFDTVFTVDTLTLLDTVFSEISDTVWVVDTVATTDTVQITDTVTVTDTVTITDTVIVEIPVIDTTIICSEISNSQKKIVWHLFNSAGFYRLEFVADVEKPQPEQTLTITIDGIDYLWDPNANPTLVLELNLTEHATIVIKPNQPPALGHAISICMKMSAL